MSEILDVYLVGLATAWVFMGLLYIVAQIRQDTSIVDIGWGLGFVVIGLSLSVVEGGEGAVFSLVQLLVSIWGLRLFVHILLRKGGKPEDWRYANWREQWGRNHWWRSFLQVFMLQGFLMSLIAAPLYFAWVNAEAEIAPLAYVGVVIWVVGFYFEAVGDYQLTQFIKRKKNRSQASKKKKKSSDIMTEGLWRYTRHPNYFGEVTQWWGLWLVVVTYEYGFIAVVSPLIITYLLLKVSGIPMLEKKWEGDKAFEKYKKRTNAFFPAPPKKF